ncbi:uncharacterized protein LOC123295059 isoform X2 [Chrysoperla carnea]|uniref:uncharacterized protein LOC123295059 isoform X2 n=1 Tax=Chrysoperla carnea TaxID=189513 RepID=UPI001D065FF2|nr:uncharacterized protein LOC123295059 isoform X2 [Chrysoperla carnea]
MELERERCHHRPLAFDKMEGLVREMQDPVSGVPVGCQKLFLTSIPSVFLGYDLIEWLMERLGIEESEALNIANQLCQYGYFFPVSDSKNLVVKDDSSLYRFQSPYFWPCQMRTPDNVEYAIYLAKRTLRNKQRHGLDEYEVEALTNLKKNLANKWDFITMQAEEQVRIAKERKKGEKLISDSQERAYWRVYRPPPGVTSSLEQCPIPSRSRNGGTRPRKRTLIDCRREVDFLRNSLTRTRIKVSTALESMINYVETYTEYDPLISGIQPSNPWISEDLTYWQLNGSLVELPTEKRVKRWALSMEELVSDPTGLQEFTNYLRKEYSHENIRFWLAVNDLRRSSQSQIGRKVCEIFEEFLAPGAPCEINIDGKTMEKVHQELNTPSRFTFDAAAEHVYTLLLKKDCYPRFIRSEHYKKLLADGVQPLHKKRFFGFVGPTKKKSSAATIQNQSLLHQSGGGSSSTSAQPGSQSTGSGGVLGRRRGSDRSLSGSAHELAVSSVKDPSNRVSHSHSQSNLSEIPYRDASTTPASGVSTSSGVSPQPAPSGGSQDVCPWDSTSPQQAEPPTTTTTAPNRTRNPNIAIAASSTTSEDICPWQSQTTGTTQQSSSRSRKNSQQFDSGSSSSDISSTIADVSERLKRTCMLTQQNTIEGDYRRSHYSRKLSTASCIEATRRSSMSTMATSTKALPESTRPSVSSFEDFAPQRSFDSPSVTSPCNVLFVSENSDNNINKDNVQKTTITKKLTPHNLRKTSSVTSSSTAPIISVSSVMDDNNVSDVTICSSSSNSNNNISNTEQQVGSNIKDTTITELPTDILEEPEHSTNVVERQSTIAEEEDVQKETIDTSSGDNLENIDDLNVKPMIECAASTSSKTTSALPTTPHLALAPLAEPDGGSPLSEYPPEEFQDICQETTTNVPVTSCSNDENLKPQQSQQTVAESSEGNKNKADGKMPKKNSDVCPWEDEESCKVDTPFVKTYATLGYL